MFCGGDFIKFGLLYFVINMGEVWLVLLRCCENIKSDACGHRFLVVVG